DHPTVTGAEALRRAVWLAKRHAITILPAVSSLRALRQNATGSRASRAFVGFGNPLLEGPDDRYKARARLALEKQECPKTAWPSIAGLFGVGINTLAQRGGMVDVADIRAQIPLPETADELCSVARNLGVPNSDIWLGKRATERE